jgi:hypothetical protein
MPPWETFATNALSVSDMVAAAWATPAPTNASAKKLLDTRANLGTDITVS